MAWSDGITKEIGDFLDGVSGAVEGVRKIAEGVIDSETMALKEQILARVHSPTGGLRNAFYIRRKTDNGPNWHGYEFGFEGNAPNGEPYQKIANIQNYGWEHMAGTQFVSKAIHKLKGMDDRIEARIEEHLSKRT